MKLPKPLPIKEIAKILDAEIIGDDQLVATGINEIHKVEEGDITFVDLEKYFQKSLSSKASIIILNKRTKCPPGKALLVCDEPFKAYDGLVRKYRPFRPLMTMINEEADIHPSAIIEPNVVVASDVKIGENCYIQANVTIMEHVVIGDNVTIQSGTVIGSDAFYFKKTREGYEKWRSGGRVVIEDNVDIGALCTINRGVSGDTVIGAGSKLDCQVQIGHGVVIGRNCLIAAQAGIGGKTIIEDGVVIYGQAGIAQNIRIGKKAIISAKAGVSKEIEGGKLYFGIPAGEARSVYRELAALRHLPDFFKNYYEE